MKPLTKAVAAVVLLAGLAVLSAGVGLLVIRQVDPKATATVDHCETSGGSRNYRVDCTGHWTLAGRLVVGTVDGVDTDAVGKRVPVTVSGDTAHSRSLTLPIALLAVGAAGIGLCVAYVRAVRRATRRSVVP